MRYTLEQVVDFCWTNKKRRAFKDMDYEKVARIILHASKTDKLRLVEDEQGLCGVMVFRVFDDSIFVDFLVTVRLGFFTFVKYYQDNYPGFNLYGERDGKRVKFNTKILCQHLARTIQKIQQEAQPVLT